MNTPQEPAALAKRLREFSEYDVDLEYTYEDMSRSKYTEKLLNGIAYLNILTPVTYLVTIRLQDPEFST